jgi:hypothetical protein
MKNVVLNLAAFVLFSSAFVACKKDEPTFQKDLVGHWLSTQVTVGGVDVTSSYTFDLTLEQSLEFSLDVTTVVPLTGQMTQSFGGDWTEDETKQDVTLNYSDGAKKTWDIISISASSMTAELIEDNTRYQVKFNRQ